MFNIPYIYIYIFKIFFYFLQLHSFIMYEFPTVCLMAQF